MFNRYFTDERMLIISICFEVVYLVCVALFLRNRDWVAAVFLGAFCFDHVAIVYYFYLLYLGDRAITLVPESGLFLRPALIAKWSLILMLCVFYLYIRHQRMRDEVNDNE